MTLANFKTKQRNFGHLIQMAETINFDDISCDFPAAFAINNRYQIHRLIGKGGTGRVYEGHQTNGDFVLRRKVAVKVLYQHDRIFRVDQHGLRYKNRVARFEREVRIACRLRSPYLVYTLDGGYFNLPSTVENEPAQGLFLVMEYIDGTALSKCLVKQKPFEIQRALSIMKDLLYGLEDLHRYGVLHRDLKPDNIVLEQKGFQERAKIIDLGISKYIDDHEICFAEEEPTIFATRIGDVVGTFRYMAPESFDFDQKPELSFATDIYSLGMIFFEMLSGRRCFELRANQNMTPQEYMAYFMFQHKNSEPVLNHQKRGHIPPGLYRILCEMTAQNMHKRYQTARACRQAIEDWENNNSLASFTSDELEVDTYEPDTNDSMIEELVTQKYILNKKRLFRTTVMAVHALQKSRNSAQTRSEFLPMMLISFLAMIIFVIFVWSIR